MRVKILFAILGLACSSCSQSNSGGTPNVDANEASSINAIDRLNTAKAPSCWSDAECDPDQNCECPLNSDNGNCEHPGVCVPRDKAVAPNTMKERAGAPADIADCRSMSNLSFIPAGYHPTTAQWVLNAQGQINDMVCVVKTNGKEIRVLRWLDYPLPAGYHTLRTETGVDTTFRGCRQWTEWQGNRQCTTSFDLYVMRKNEEGDQ